MKCDELGEEIVREQTNLQLRVKNIKAAERQGTIMENILLESDDKFLQLSALSIEGITVHRCGRLLHANAAFANMLEVDLSEILDKDALQFVPSKYHEFVQSVRESGDEAHYEIEMFKKDGSPFPVEVSSAGVRFASDALLRIGVIRDLTERKNTEKLLKALSSKWPIGSYVVQNGRFCYVNLQLQKCTGFSETELLEKNPLDLIHPEDRESVQVLARAMLRGEIYKPYQHRVYNKAGEVRWVLETVTPICYKGGRAVLGSYMDVTERKRAEQALGDVTDRELEVLQLIGQGCSNEEIANQLFITRRTVEYHRYSLMQKLNMHKQSEVVRYAIQRDLLETIA